METCSIQNFIKRGKTVILTLRQGFDDPGNSAVRQWTDKETYDLIALMREFLIEFKNPKRRKKEVWVDVTKKMHMGESVWTPEDCRKKWSNMIRTFKTIEEQRREEGGSSKRIKWQFHEEMSELLACEGAENLPEAAAVCTFLKDFPIIVDSLSSSASQGDQLSVLHQGLDMSHQGQGQTIEESVHTDPMEFYLVDNQDGSNRGGVGDDHTVQFTAANGDFHTLATVAAAAASASTCVQGLTPETGVLNSVQGKRKLQNVTLHPSSLLSTTSSLGNSKSSPAGRVPSAQLASELKYSSSLQHHLQLTSNSSQSSLLPSTSDSSSAVTMPSMLSVEQPPVSSLSPQTASAYFKKKSKYFRKESRKRPANPDEDNVTGDPLVDKFIAISNKQSQKVLERMEKHHEDTLAVMRERNKILENMVTFLKSQIAPQPTVVAPAPMAPPNQTIYTTPSTIRVVNAQTLARAGLLGAVTNTGITGFTVKK